LSFSGRIILAYLVVLLLLPVPGSGEVLYSARSGRHFVLPSTSATTLPGEIPTSSPSVGLRAAQFGAEDSQNEPLLEKPVAGNEYRLGPGDVLALTIQGAMASYDELKINPEGTVAVPGAGQVRLAGLLLDDARKAVEDEVHRAYHNVQVSLTLLRLRRFTVYVLGQVKQPGQYTASAVTRASEEIRLAGGLLPEASERSIHLLRGEKGQVGCDLQRFIRTGELDANPQMQDGDVLVVDFRRAGVLIHGEVHEPGEFEFLPGDSLGNLIGLAGGLTDQASLDTVEVGRYDPAATVPRVI
jgi:polysaccharide biosynthesis/export protein